MFSSADGEINYPLLGIVSVFVLLALIIIYYVLMDYSSPGALSTTDTPIAPSVSGGVTGKASNSTAVGAPIIPETTQAQTSQVFNVADNVFTYDDAEAVCKAYGSELATYDQLVAAYKQGANWCNYGWTKGQMALFPVQKSFWDKVQENDPERRNDCGMPGINGGYFENKNQQFGVNCYGPKRAPRTDESMKQSYMSDKERALQEKIFNFKRQLGNFKLTPFNEDKWAAC
jgi:hypothetical protein